MVKLYNDNIKSDSFANHFVKHLRHLNDRTIKAKDVKHLFNISIISKLNPISASKKFGTDDCQLCMQERIEITKRWLRGKKASLINKNTKIYGACRHKARLHVFCEQVTTTQGTDEGNYPEKEAE